MVKGLNNLACWRSDYEHVADGADIRPIAIRARLAESLLTELLFAPRWSLRLPSFPSPFSLIYRFSAVSAMAGPN